MKILIDIGHPAHIHYFRNVVLKIANKKDILFTTRDKEITLNLLSNYKFNYKNLGKPYKTKVGKAFGIIKFTIKLFIIVNRFKPDVILNATHYSAIVAWITKIPHIAIEDSFNMEQVKLYLPFTNVVLTSNYTHPDLGSKNIEYNGYQELSYLHPSVFKPDKSIYSILNISNFQRYAIIRFVSWNASHDYGQSGIENDCKYAIIKLLIKYVKVFITSESSLPFDLLKYQINIPPERMHDALYFSDLYVGEGATMASEAAILGVPSVYINSIERPYTTELEKKYGLVYNFRNTSGVLEIIEKLIRNTKLKQEFKIKRDKMLSDKINVADFFVWFIKNYPESFDIMKNNPDFQNRFK